MNISSFLIGYQTGKNSAGSGSSADVRYVTFMSYDGLTEYGKKAVAVGDDCADPIARGIFNTPTRESDVQYNYTFYGWATEANGGMNSAALKAVTEDRTVYANFTAIVRYYTITYYDGNTVLKTVSLPYGATPETYLPEKEGYGFDGWNPEVATVTGNASYYAKWTEAITFAGGSWADISRIAEAGEAADYFALGDKKDISYTYNGTKYDATVEIVAFNFDNKADGSGKAGITVCLTDTAPWYHTKHSSNNFPDCTWPNCNARTLYNNTIFGSLPSELRNVIKPVTKISNGYDGTAEKTFTTTDKLWMPSLREVGGADSTNYSLHVEQGNSFQRFTRKKTNIYFLRTSPFKYSAASSAVVDNMGNYKTGSSMTSGWGFFGFCI